MLMKVIVILKIVMIMTYYDYDSGDGSDCDGELEDDSRTQTCKFLQRQIPHVALYRSSSAWKTNKRKVECLLDPTR